MSSATTDFGEEQQRPVPQGAVGAPYVLTEEERKVLQECNRESFYRSLPAAMVGMAITRFLISKGKLTVSPTFGSLPKMAFAGFCGYMIGKVSYLKTCQEKFMKLENSALGQALRQERAAGPPYSKGPPSELSDPNAPSFEPMFQPAEGQAQSQMHTQPRDYGYGYNQEPPMQTRRPDDFNPPVQSYRDEEDEPRKKPVLYEDLRLKNRENYEVTLTQKAETLLKSPPEKQPERPRKEVKKNIYGDTWEE